MKKQEIKKLSKDEILKNIDKLKKDLFNFRFQKVNSQVTNPSKIGETKKTIARLKTSLRGKIISFERLKNEMQLRGMNQIATFNCCLPVHPKILE